MIIMSSPTHRNLTPLPIVELSQMQGDVPTRSKYRTLASKGIVSGGWHVVQRGKRGFSGSRKYHSALALFAVKALDAGDDSGAAYLGAEARRVEEAFADEVVHFLRERSFADLPHAAFYQRLLQATEEVLTQWPRRADFIYGGGVIRGMDGEDVQIVVETKKHAGSVLALPAELARMQNLEIGMQVLVLRTVVGHRAVVEVVPAVEVSQEGDGLSEGRAYLELGAGAPSLPLEAMGALARLPKGAIPVADVKRLAG